MLANVPLGRGRKLSGLEALAEASRQIEYPRGTGQIDMRHESLVDPALEGVYSDVLPISGNANVFNQSGKSINLILGGRP